ncbi:MAG: universal stress protein, partial [Desulfobulbaceae bacterium]|nr:universal stress protein [Desulfobulbaceae bacterium]
ISYDDQLETEMVRSSEERLDSFLEENMGRSSIPFAGEVLKGHVTVEILNCAEREESDLIIMGTHGYSRFEKMLIGSVAEEVVRLGPCPVLTVNPNKEGDKMKDIKKILVPVDFSDNSVKLLESAIDFAGKSEAELLVVFVVEDMFTFSGLSIPHIAIDVDQFEREMVEGSKKRLEGYLEDNMEGIDVSYSAKVLKGNVAEELCGCAENEKVDMIMMGTHGYRGLEKVLIGSVAEKVVRTAPCPVLTINPYK